MVDIFEPDKLKAIADKVENIQVDYFIVGKKKKYAIERKTWSDLFSSLKEGRVWDQLTRLKNLQAEGYEPRLLIEGHKFILFKYKKITQAQIAGIEEAILSYGVPIMYADTQDLTIMKLKLMDQKAGDTTEWQRPTIAKTGRTPQEEAEDVLAAIDGIGRKSANKLIKYFGTVKEAINGEIFEVASVIGVREAKHFEDVINRKLS